MPESHSGIESTLSESRVFPPPVEFSTRAHIKSIGQYQQMYRQSIDQPEIFWAEVAENFHWFKKMGPRFWNGTHPDAKWFGGGKTNLSFNCLDHQVAQGRGEKPAIIFEAEPMGGDGQPMVRTISYRELKDQVCRFANGLKMLGVKKGDRVTIYLPMVPEAAVAMLACARIGAAHSVVFGGFSSQSIVDRVEDAQSEFLITADGGFRRGVSIALKKNVDQALKKTSRVKTVVVLKHTGETVEWNQERDRWWSDVIDGQSTDCPAEPMDAEDLLFVLYTSGSTGKPKGIIHTTAGYMVGTYLTTKYVFDLQEKDVYWCTARRGLDHGAQLCGVWPAEQRGNHFHV